METGKHHLVKMTMLLLAVFAIGAGAQLLARSDGPSNKTVPLTLSKIRWLPDTTSTNVADSTERRMTFGVRSDGSTVEIAYFDGPDGVSSAVTNIVDYRKGVQIVLESSTRSIMTVPITSDRRPGNAIGRPDWCGGVEVDTTVHGFAMARRTFDAESYRYVNFYAPELGCVLLESRVFKLLDEANNEYRLIQEDRVESIVLGEPDESLFMAGEGFVERSPAELAVKMAEVRGRELDQALLSEDPFVRMAEQNYLRLRD